MTLLTRLLLVIALAILPTLLVVFVHETNRHHEQRQDIERAARSETRQLATAFRSFIDNGQKLLQALAEMQAVANLQPDECDRIITRLHQQFPIYGNIVVTDDRGVIRCGPGHGLDISQRAYMQQARTTRSFVVGTSMVSLVSQQQILPIAYPATDDNGRIRSILVAGLRVDELQKRFASHPLRDGAAAVITDRTGTVLVQLPDGSSKAPLAVQAADLAASAPASTTVSTPDGSKRVLAFEPPATDPWHAFYVSISLPQGPMLHAIMQRTQGELLAFLAALVFSAVSIAYVWRRTVGRPVRDFVATIEQLKQDESARVQPQSLSELGQLGHAFNELLDRLHARSQALADSEARSQSMLERMRTAARAVQASASSIVIIDARRSDMPIVDVNPAFERITGFARSEAIGRNYRLLIGLDDSPALAELREAMREPRERTVQLTGAHRSGTPFHCELRVAPVFDEHGQITHYVAVQNDITERVESERRLAAAKEEAEASNRAKSQFLANMSHELRTPLNAIIGFSEILQTELFGTMPARYRDYSTDINEAGRHLLALLNDLLDLARIEGGKITLDIQPVQVGPLAEGCLGLVQPDALRRGIKLHAAVDPDLEATCDPTRLRQMLLNLLTNAIKFTPRDGSVTLQAEHVANGNLVLQVRDTGIGMTESEIRVALEPFGQVENTLARKHDGVGLGLPIAKRLAELHGGTLTVASRSGQGTTVTITLPPPT